MQQVIPQDVTEQLRLPSVSQIGYIVPDIDEAIAFCRDAFGMRPWLLMEERPEPCIQRGESVHPVLKIGLTYAGPLQIELIQVMEGETFHLDHIRDSKEGAHHLGFMVRNLNKRLKVCADTGIDVIQRGTIKDKGFVVDFAYLDTVERAGIVLELIQWRLGPIPVPINRLVHQVVSAVGSWTFFRGRVIK